MKLLLLAFGKPILAAAGFSFGTYAVQMRDIEAQAEFGAGFGAAAGELQLGDIQLEELVVPADEDVEIEIVPAVRIQPALPREEEPTKEKQP